MPLVSNLLVNIAPRDYFQKLMMIVMLPIMIGPVFGPILGAIIVEYGNWQWIFWINVPIMLIAAALNFWIVPSIPATDKTTKIDWLGITLLGFGSASLIYGLSRAGKLATFNNSDTWLFASIGLFALFIYVIWGIYKKKNSSATVSSFQGTCLCCVYR